MIGTIVSILIALYLIFLQPEVSLNPLLISSVMVIAGSIFILLLPLGFIMSWGPLHRAEHDITPRILDMFRKDFHIRLIAGWLIVFPLISYLFAIALLFIPTIPRHVLLAIWIILFGIALDLMLHYSRRLLRYLNPFAAISLFTKGAHESIQEEHEIDLCHWIDGLSEISYKAIQRHSTSLAEDAINELQMISRLFFTSSKSISHHVKDKQTEALGITDKVSYTMFYLYQRLELIFDKALKNRLEPTCSHIVTNLGKITVDAAKFDISMSTPPLHYIGKFIKRAEEAGLEEVGIKGSCTLLGVAKAILTEIDITYCELQDPFLSIINTLEELSKAAFRRDKNVSIKLLTQPLLDLKALFTTGKAETHQDTPVIVKNIDRVIGEFEALEMVLRTIPTIPQEKQENQE